MSSFFSLSSHLKHSDLRQALPPRAPSTPALTSRGKQDAGQDTRGCKPWNYSGSCACEKEKESYSSQHKCRVCQQDHPMLHCPKHRNPIPSTFWHSVPPPHPSSLDPTSDLSMDNDVQDTRSRTENSSHCFIRPTAPSTATSAIIRHILASRSDQPNGFWDKNPSSHSIESSHVGPSFTSL